MRRVWVWLAAAVISTAACSSAPDRGRDAAPATGAGNAGRTVSAPPQVTPSSSATPGSASPSAPLSVVLERAMLRYDEAIGPRRTGPFRYDDPYYDVCPPSKTALPKHELSAFQETGESFFMMQTGGSGGVPAWYSAKPPVGAMRQWGGAYTSVQHARAVFRARAGHLRGSHCRDLYYDGDGMRVEVDRIDREIAKPVRGDEAAGRCFSLVRPRVNGVLCFVVVRKGRFVGTVAYIARDAKTALIATVVTANTFTTRLP